MPGFLNRIATSLSGGDTRLVEQIQEFASAFLSQGEVARTLGLRREEALFLNATLSRDLYRAYCTEHLKRGTAESADSRLQQIRAARLSQLGLAPDVAQRLETALGQVSQGLVDLARRRGKLSTGFASVDGLTESVVSETLGPLLVDVKAAKRKT